MKKLKARKKRSYSNLAFPLLSLLLLCVGIGFAYVETNLRINGDFLVSNNSWDVHLEKGFVISRDAEVINEPVITDLTKISFSVKLNSANGYYEVYSYMKNDGAVNAEVSEINFGDIADEVRPYMTYTLTYGDGEPIQIGDIIAAGDFEQVKITVKLVDGFGDAWLSAHPTIGTSDSAEDVLVDLSMNFSCEIKYSQNFGDEPARIKTSLVQSLGNLNDVINTTPSFTVNPTAATSGLYVAPETEGDNYPIYYYRGIVDNNNVIFANFCWKIVRTTDRGGTKLIYNGVPNANKQCVGTGTATQISASNKINAYSTSLADVGYMYGDRYIASTWTTSTKYIYGNDVEYDDTTGMYTLLDTASTTATATQTDGVNRHYTCKSTTDSTCSVVYYAYTYYSTTAYAFALSGVSGIEEAKEKMFTNTNDSALLTTLTTWYETNIETKGFSTFIEDAIWCNDRTIVNGALRSKDNPLIASYGAYFASYVDANGGRGLYTASAIKPAIKEEDACPNKNDQFTTYNVNYGNRKLKYSIGLLTADEVTLAGNGYKSYVTTAYLRTGQNLWTMTPAYYGTNASTNFYFSNNIAPAASSNAYYLRPSIVLKAYTKVAGGDGTTTSPYLVGPQS